MGSREASTAAAERAQATWMALGGGDAALPSVGLVAEALHTAGCVAAGGHRGPAGPRLRFVGADTVVELGLAEIETLAGALRRGLPVDPRALGWTDGATGGGAARPRS